MKEDLSQKLLSLKKTFITLNELENIVLANNYDELRAIVNEQIADEVIMAVGKKNTNGLIPPLHLKYRICNTAEDLSPYFDEIRHLHPDLKISEYLANPHLYKMHRHIVLPLSDMLKTRSETLRHKMSKNERAYSIWHDEKMLDDSKAKSVIAFLEIAERLNYYLTPEPFFDFVLRSQKEMTVLIIENKDTWFTFRKLLTKNPEKCCLHGTQLDAVLYGEGNKVTKPGGIQAYADNVLSANVQFLYFGDLDFTGIDLFSRVCKANPGANIKLFAELYQDMLDLTEWDQLGQIRKKQKTDINMNGFLSFFSADHMIMIQELLKANKYIPQEAINYPILATLLQVNEG
ncbi:hypothetical protein GH810_09885 [Acetobacterium paludosum]|uniref:Wadjet protein JetD C-terminal domain-containing protein n=1 Tax=Acetobacterium paludosum TaxID=52693 RepID=A0A923KWY3_9FIRM|nr:Wadjet anti-phage system protein JetD domain-containing protein [Acetobacterium paludosum]MBC3888618.1 hypothetical protein [Acetobacterium paludosum]